MKIDFHVHTDFSIGKNTPAEVAAVAKKKGLDAIAITDRMSLKGWKSFSPANFFIIPGVEIPTDKGIILAYGVKELPPSTNFDEVFHWANDFGYVLVPSQFDDKEGIGELALEKFKVVEAINAGTPRKVCESAVTKCTSKGIKYLCNSGARSVSTIGEFYNHVDAEPTLHSVIEALKKGKFTPRLKFPSLYDSIKSKLKL